MSLHYARVPAQPWAALEERWLPRLPQSKRASVARRRHAEDRNATLLGLALLEHALARLALAFDAGALEYPRAGKPRLAGAPDFSISHAAGLVACALASRGRVGLDLEPAGAVRRSTALRVLRDAERALVERGELDATDAWVIKEAVVKAAGRGVGAMRSVVLGGASAILDGERFVLERVALGDTHRAWIASDRRATTIAVEAVGAERFAPLPPRR